MVLLAYALAGWIVFAVLCFLWCLKSIRYFHLIESRFGSLPDESRAKYHAFKRRDFGKLDSLSLLVGAYFIMPFRLMIFIFGLPVNTAIFGVISWINLGGRESKTSRYIARVAGKGLGRLGLLGFGVTSVKHHHTRGGVGKNNDDSVSPHTHLEQATCIVSNHVSAVDILYFMGYIFPSFVAKASVSENIFVGASAKAMQTIFVKRLDEAGRSRAASEITERIRLNRAGDAPPIVIFPEGTTSSGHTLLSFKKGAFTPLCPVQPVVLIYRCAGVNISFDLLPFWCWFPLVLSSPSSVTLDVYCLPAMSPPTKITVTPDGQTIKDDNGEENVNHFMESVRGEMLKALERHGGGPLPAPHRGDISSDDNNNISPNQLLGSYRLKLQCIEDILRSRSASCHSDRKDR